MHTDTYIKQFIPTYAHRHLQCQEFLLLIVECVNHNLLLAKLEFYGITDRAYKLIKSYREGRYQRGVLNNNSPDSCSNWGANKTWCPPRLNTWSTVFFPLC